VSLVTNPEMAPTVMMKKVGPWIRVSLSGVMTLGYFIDGSAREPSEEVVPDAGKNEVVVFEEFFVTGLWMPPQLVLTDILLKFWVQFHQLTLNAFAQLSKYFWAVLSFGGKPSGDSFVKRYEMHYQPKKVDADGIEKYQQFCCLNFHARRVPGRS
jgi:hypothetical protein